MAVHRAARPDHHVESARRTGERASAPRVATPRHRQAADLRAGDLRLRGVAAASGLRHVGTMMLGCGLGRDGNHEHGDRKCDSFIMTSVVCVRLLNARTGVPIRQAPKSGRFLQFRGERRSKAGVGYLWVRRTIPAICDRHEPSCPKSCGLTSPKSKPNWTRTAKISLSV